ncbi:MAG: hypothetical protein HDQ91_07415, partial [Desulfovibrio sp.]|nr:hypothetical protein [Desulfovibrio sp.]
DISYCEDAGIDQNNVAIANKLLEQAFEFGLVKAGTTPGAWPSLIWAVHNGWTFQGHLTQSQDGAYHGYPLAKGEDFAKDIQKCLIRRQRSHA